MMIEILCLIIVLFILLYRFITKEWSCFDGQNIAVARPSFPFGSRVMKDVMFGKINFLEMITEINVEFPKEKIVGYFLFQVPRYNINDIDLAKQVLVKDFEYFTDRAAITTGDEVFNNFLTNLTGEDWKRTRMLMSGVFSSGKLKLMVPHIDKAGMNLVKHLSQVCERGEVLDMKNLGGLLTLDSIATAGFGLDINSFDDPENRFRIMALQLTNAPGYRKTSIPVLVLKTLMFKAFPEFSSKVLKMKFSDAESMDFFSDIIRRTYRHRMESKERRNDLIDLIVDEVKKADSSANNSGQNKQKEDEFEDEFEKDAELDSSNIKQEKVNEEIVLIANAILFFFAGFDTSASGFGAIAHKLCMYPDYQERVYEEIMDVLGKDEQITFEKINELKFLDRFIFESFRQSPFVTFLERACTKNYQVPGTDVVIPKGTVITVATQDLHKLESAFYNPEEFDPENFAPENKPNKFAFQGFGQGPRNCIGMRYAMLVLKIGIVHMLRHYRVVKGSDDMPVNLKINKEMNNFEGGVMAKFERRE